MFAQNSGNPLRRADPGQRETALSLCVITVLRVPISPMAMLSQVEQCLHSISPLNRLSTPQQHQKQ